MFIHIPVEEFGVGSQRDMSRRWDRFIRATIETICQYYTNEFKIRNQIFFNPFARLNNRNGRVPVRQGGQIIRPNPLEIEHAIQRFEERFNEIEKEFQYNNRFLVNSYTNVGGGMMAMPQTPIDGLYSPCYFINGQLKINDVSEYDIVLIIGDHFYSEAFVSDIIQDLSNRNASTKLIVVGTYRPRIEWCVEHPIKLSAFEKAYNFNFANKETHTLKWDNLEQYKEALDTFLRDQIDGQEGVNIDRIIKLLISPFVHQLLPITEDDYRGYLKWLFEYNEYCNYLSYSIDVNDIICRCKECELFGNSPKYLKFREIVRERKIDDICVVNSDLPDILDKSQFIKIRRRDDNPKRGVKRNKNRRCFILNTRHENTINLLERYCIRGNIHILTYDGFDGALGQSSSDWYGWENYSPKKGSNHRPQFYEITLEDGSTKEIYGSVILDNQIINTDDLCSIIGNNSDGQEVYRVTICNDDTELLDRYVRAKYPDSISDPDVSWIEELCKKEYMGKEYLYKQCKEKGYRSKPNTFEQYFTKNVAYPKKYDDLKAILNFLGLDDDTKRKIIKAAHNHNLKGQRGKEMKEDILNYKLTGESSGYIDSDYNRLLEELLVVSISKVKKNKQ
jgi:hypothetical protein